MELLVLDKSFNSVQIIDNYISLIWTVRYTAAGDFELHIPMYHGVLTHLKDGYYLYLRDSDRIMIIEDIKIDTSKEDGVFVTISGRSLESILTRRIVWNHTVLTGNLQVAIQTLINQNVISPSDTTRKISNFIFETSNDTNITSKTIDAQYRGEELYEVVQKLCAPLWIGFRIILTDDNKFKFNLFHGKNRSYEQSTLPYVIFSPEFENLIRSSYTESSLDYKTVALVGGEGEGNARKIFTQALSDGAGIELNRREMFTDAGSVSTNSSGGTVSAANYNKHLAEKGIEALSEKKLLKTFDSDADVNKTFIYGKDFDIGDIVQFSNEFGTEVQVRVTEIIFTQDGEGYRVYPTFEVV